MRRYGFERLVSLQLRARTGTTLLAVLLGLLVSVTGATDGDYSLTGKWHLSHHESDILPVHAALTPDEGGRVLIMAGSGNDPTFSRGVNQVRTWDPVTEEVFNAPGEPEFGPSSIPAADPPTLHDNDMFCSAHVYLPDAHLFVAGGNLEYPTDHPAGGHPVHPTPPDYDSPEARPACHDFLGLRDSFIYHHHSVEFTHGPKMQRGRWYPSLLSLGDGRVLAVSGLDDIGQGGSKGYSIGGQTCQYGVLNRTADIFDPATMSWGSPIATGGPGQINPDNFSLYPYVHLLPTGKVFLAAPTGATEVFDPETLVREGAQKFSTRGGRDYGFSTLLALRPSEGYRARVLNAGGGNNTGVTNKTEIIDFSAVNPQWTAASNMMHGRAQGASVLMPDGKLLVVGGTSGADNAHNAILQAEIYDPATNAWSSAGTSFIPRLYHSVAILLPDGRVFVAGSNPHDTMDPNERLVETRIEVYSPPYLFKGERPAIPVHPEVVNYTTSFTIQLGSEADVDTASQVVLLRLGSTTHTRNFDQRLVELTFAKDPDFPMELTVTGPLNGNIAPPGPYMMYVLNSNGVPSLGHLVNLSN
jgi:hypothetical protein